MDLNNKRVVIIGGSSGISLATAKAAAELGARVLLGARSREKLDAASAASGLPMETCAVDMTREKSVRDFFQKTGLIDHLVFSAGMGGVRPFMELGVETCRFAFETKFIGAFLAAKHGAPRIVPSGSIVLFSGAASIKPVPGLALAAALNGAIEALTRSLAVELAPVRVNAVSPGVLVIANSDDPADEDRTHLYDDMADKLPVGRVGTPEDMADAALFLMKNGYMTGSILRVDGGALIV